MDEETRASSRTLETADRMDRREGKEGQASREERRERIESTDHFPFRDYTPACDSSARHCVSLCVRSCRGFGGAYRGEARHRLVDASVAIG